MFDEKAYKKQWYIENKAKIKENAKQYREEHKEDIRKYKIEWCIRNKERLDKKKRQYYLDNREKILKRTKQYNKDNPEKRRESNRQWKKNNPEKVKEQGIVYRQKNIEKELDRQKIYRRNNKEKVKIARRKYANQRMKIDLRYKLNHRIRCGIALSLKGDKNGWHWENLVGYGYDKLKKHLQKTIPKNYTWQDFLEGQLHIEHIIPIRAFVFKSSKDKDFKQCWSLYNLRLLPAFGNRIKKDNIKNPILLRLLLS